MKVLKTPESRFSSLKDYPFKPNYMDVGGVKMHYIDEGDKKSKTIFLLHGQPSWSYLYRHMIPLLVKEGYRVIAPDLIGFGKSDKPVDPSTHTYKAHVEWMSVLVSKLNINNAAAFMQDWGGMIGLRVLANNPNWLSRLVVANTALVEIKPPARWLVPSLLKISRLKAGEPTIQDFSKKMSFSNWSGYFSRSPELKIGKIMQLLTTRELSQAEMDAYDAPYPTPDYYAGPRRMPEIGGNDLNGVYDDWQKLKQWKKPVLTLFSDKDPFLAGRGFDTLFQTNFEGAKGQPHITVTNASHFLQEDKFDELASKILSWLNQTNF